MSPKNREDFVWVRPLPQFGSVHISNGPVEVFCTLERPCEVTRAEWEHILKQTEVLELCEPFNGLDESEA